MGVEENLIDDENQSVSEDQEEEWDVKSIGFGCVLSTQRLNILHAFPGVCLLWHDVHKSDGEEDTTTEGVGDA